MVKKKTFSDVFSHPILYTFHPEEQCHQEGGQRVRRHLTPPPSSTNVERLFSIGGLTATDHRAALAGEKLDQILFLRENALMAHFKLGWE